MSEWPDTLKIAPLREWPVTLRPAEKRRESAFATPLTTTLVLLERELRAVHAREPELLIAVPPGQFRRDGRPRADARAQHPGVVLQFTTAVGRLAYPCDSFTTWQDNLRAIALSLEALRKVDRYGVTSSGEQYRGFLAIEGRPSVHRDHEAWLRDFVAAPPQWTLDTVLRNAKRRAHPDMGGDADLFQQVLDAERALRGAAA